MSKTFRKFFLKYFKASLSIKTKIFSALILTGTVPLILFIFLDFHMDSAAESWGPQERALGVFVGFATTLLFVAGLSGYFLRNLFRPLAELIEMVQALRDRDYMKLRSWNVAPASNEIQELSHSVKAISEEVFLYTTQLQEVVENRTAHLRRLTDDIMKKNEELMGVVEVKNEFVGMAAHDLRSPIGVIRGFCDIMISQADPQTQTHEFLNRCRSQCDFMLDLLDELLEVSELEAGKSDLKISEISLKAKAHKAVDMYQSYAQKKSISINLEVPENLPFVVADRRKVMQIFSNLLSNAIKYSPSGTLIGLQVQYFELTDTFRICFKDQGQGIPEKEIQKLFKPFSRTSVRATGGEKSTGLGLSIVSRLVALHHGKVWVESAVGKGSQFFVELPRFYQPAQRKHESEEAQAPKLLKKKQSA